MAAFEVKIAQNEKAEAELDAMVAAGKISRREVNAIMDEGFETWSTTLDIVKERLARK